MSSDLHIFGVKVDVWRTGNPPKYIVVCARYLNDVKSAKLYEIYAS